MPNPLYEATFKIPDVYYFPFDKQGLEKPWEAKTGGDAARTEDYFNYGMFIWCNADNLNQRATSLIQSQDLAISASKRSNWELRYYIKLNSTLKIKQLKEFYNSEFNCGHFHFEPLTNFCF